MRDEQAVMIRDIEEVLDERGHIVLEAPTGFGKTITSLYPTVKYALKNSKKIVYLVRTNSQEQKVIEEAKKLGVVAVSLQGRTHMCPLAMQSEELKNGNPEEISLLCSKLKKETKNGNENACPYYSQYLKHGEELRRYIRDVHTSEDIFEMGLRLGQCPYEAIKDTLKEANVITLPYIYFLAPFLRNSLLERMGVTLNDLIVVIDEAHNLPEFAREMRSDELTENSLELAEKECLKYGNPLIKGIPCGDLIEYIKEAIYRMEQFVDEDEGLVPQYAFEEEIGKLASLSVNRIPELAMEMVKLGIGIREEKIKRKKLPRSYIYHAGNFLLQWKDSYQTEYIHIVKINSNPRVEIFCLDPAGTTEILINAHSTVHMSGTLSLESYRYLLNLPESTLLRRYPSPFPKENLKILYVDDVTTRYGEIQENIPRIAEYIERIVKLGKNTAVFFPSYSLLSEILKITSIDALVEERGIKQVNLSRRIENFRKKGGVLFSVLGGRIAEGMDFPGKELEIVVIAGIPYPKPTARLKMLMKYYDYKFGRGWELAFKVPASIKMRQAIGRLIRNENDRGAAVILDKRIVTFSEIPAEKSTIVEKDLREFFHNEEKGEEGRHRDM